MKNLTGKNVRVREGRWHYRFMLAGQERTGPTGLAGTKQNQKAAEQFAAEERKRLLNKEERAVAIPFFEAAAEFIEWCKYTEYRSKPNTAGRIKTSFASAVAFFDAKPVQQINAQAIEEYKTFRIMEHGVRDITVRHDLHALSVFFGRYAMKKGWTASNPVDLVTIPSDRDAVREHVISAEEEDAYFNAAFALHAKHLKSHPGAQPNLADVARLMLDQGPRPEELLAAKVTAFDPKARTLLIEGGKTRAARRTLSLTDASVAILERRSKLGSIWLFPSDRHEGHHMTKLSCTHDRVCVEAGVSFVLYDWRHTFATRQIEDGNPAAVVAAIMGHSGLRSIHRYVHPTAQSQKDAMKKYEAAQKRRKLKVV